MKKIALLALVTIFGFTGFGFSSKGTARTEFNYPKIVEKKNANASETISPAFNIKSNDIDYTEINGVDVNAFILSNNIIEKKNSKLVYENLDLSFEIQNVELSNIAFNDDENCLKVVKTEDRGNEGYLVSLKPLFKPKDNLTVLTLSVKDRPEISLKVNVHFVDAYYNLNDKYIIKPLTINGKNHEIRVTITDGSEVSGIKLKDELELKAINNLNENNEKIVDTTLFNINDFEYVFKTKNLGLATYEVDFSREILPNYSPIIRSSKIIFKIVEDSDYYFFKMNDNNELEQIDTSKNQVLEANEQYSFYIGNNSPDFDPRDYELKENSDTSAFDALELKNDISLGIPFLKVDLITGGASRIATLDFGFIGDKQIYKSITFEISKPKYRIYVNEGLLHSPYYINEKVNFSTIPNLFSIFEGQNLIETLPEFSTTKKILGKQRIYVHFRSINKTICFDIEMSMNPKLNHDSTDLSTSSQITHFRIFLERLAFDLPVEYDDADEGYKYLKNEYKFLNAEAKQTLLDDYNFIKTYRSYITQNNFQESFFEGIVVNIDKSRYIVPSITLAGFIIVFGIVVGVSLHSIYNKKEDKKDEKRS